MIRNIYLELWIWLSHKTYWQEKGWEINYYRNRCLESCDKMKNKRTYFIITPIGNENDSIRRPIDGMIDSCYYSANECEL